MAFKQRIFRWTTLMISLVLVCASQTQAAEPPMQTPTSPLAERVENEIAASKDSNFWPLSNGMVVREMKADGKLIGGKESKTMFSKGDIIISSSRK